MLPPHLGHFLFVGRNPDRSTLFILDIDWQFGPQSLPELLRVSSQGKLRLGVVHDDDVPHPRSGRAAAHHVAIHDRNPHPAPRKLVRTSRAHNPGAHNDHIKGRIAHAIDSRQTTAANSMFREFDD
jgi:hypothetical protein